MQKPEMHLTGNASAVCIYDVVIGGREAHGNVHTTEAAAWKSALVVHSARHPPAGGCLGPKHPSNP